jgi:hypothetical protein
MTRSTLDKAARKQNSCPLGILALKYKVVCGGKGNEATQVLVREQVVASHGPFICHSMIVTQRL